MVTPTEDCISENIITIECYACKEEFTKLVPKEKRKKDKSKMPTKK